MTDQAKAPASSAGSLPIRVVKKDGKAAGFVYGSLCYYPKGWKFVPRIPRRHGSRKHYPTPDAAFPSWLKRSEVVFERVHIVGTERGAAECVVRSNQPSCEIPESSSNPLPNQE
jgi:hypothetical protein